MRARAEKNVGVGVFLMIQINNLLIKIPFKF